MIRVKALLALLCTVTAAAAPAQDDLARGFANPPNAAKVRAYWWWLNGNVTKAAITRDLEQMAAKGYGGALICDAGGPAGPTPAGPAFLTPEWRELFRHALREADRVGLELSLNLQSGWNLGGPMVTPEEAAKRVVYAEKRVEGPLRLDEALPAPRQNQGYYRDVAVLAWRVKAGQSLVAGVTAGTAQPAHAAAYAMDGDPESFWVSAGSKPGEGPTSARPEWLQVELARPAAVNGVRVVGRARYGPRECELLASDDGKAFRPVRTFVMEEGGTAVVRFDETRARFFRLVMRSSYDPMQPKAPRNVQICELELQGPEALGVGRPRRPIQSFQHKAVFQEFGGSCPDTTPLLQDIAPTPGEEDVLAKDVVDLTSRLAADGRMRWDVPEGSWVILRVGHTASGSHVSTSSPGWSGLAIDYLDPAALRSYWRQVVDPLIADAGPLAGRVLRYLHTDSWELGGVNWTPAFPEEFRKRRGYDLRPYLPVLAGRIVESRPASNRFLNDFRQTIGDLIAENHYRLMAEMAHRHGIGIHPESGGPHGAPVDALKCLGLSDVPTMEFWARARTHRVTEDARLFVKQAASAAHIYGKRIVAAEGFTSIGPHWEETLWNNHKPEFDREACEGLNRVVWHTFTCSPAEMGRPGQEYFAGTHLNPNVTWWEQAGAFLGYLNRCQFLLQQGLFVADACYYYGDHVPNFVRLKSTDPARILPGYDYDAVNAEVLLTRLRVEDGRLVLPDGMSYRVLVLPEREAISLEALRRVKELVEAGATVIGPKPKQALGLRDYPACDDEVGRLADELWGAGPAKPQGERRVGKGRIIWGRPAREVLLAGGVKPDFEYAAAQPDARLDYIHRRMPDAEIYFVCNQLERAESVRCTFRVAGKAPELWFPDTGEIRRVLTYDTTRDGRVTVPLRLDAYGSVFVTFREPAASDRIVSMKRDGRDAGPVDVGRDRDGQPLLRASEPGRYELKDARGRTTRVTVPAPPAPRAIEGPWEVRFPAGWGAPETAEFAQLVSWTRRAEEGIRYFSGTAVYTREIDVPAAMLAPGRAVVLDLGAVREFAEVRLNGRDLGILWKAPYALDITQAARPGPNRLEVRVTNLWPNRLIGDQLLPEAQRFTRTNVRKFTKDSPLLESGLLGPVMLRCEWRIPMGP